MCFQDCKGDSKMYKYIEKGRLSTYIGALERLLDDHDRLFADYSSNYDEEEIQEWEDERAALVMAIQMMEKEMM